MKNQIMNTGKKGVKEKWEVVIDFTDGGKIKGVSAEEVLKELEKIRHEK